MCENGPFVAARFKGAGGGGPPETIPIGRPELRGVRPCIAQKYQQNLLWSRRGSDVLLKRSSRMARDLRRGRLPPWRSPSRGGVLGGFFIRAADLLVGLARDKA